MSRYMENLIKSMDDDSLRLYLKRHRKSVADLEYNLDLSKEIVADLEAAAKERGIDE